MRKIKCVLGIIQAVGSREDSESPTWAFVCGQHQIQSFLRGPLRVKAHSHSPVHGCLLSPFPHPRTVPVQPAFTRRNQAPSRSPARSDRGFENVLPVWPFMTRTPEWGGETRWPWGDPLGGLRSAHRPEVRTQCLWGSRDPTCSKQHVLHRLVRIFFANLLPMSTACLEHHLCWRSSGCPEFRCGTLRGQQKPPRMGRLLAQYRQQKPHCPSESKAPSSPEPRVTSTEQEVLGRKHRDFNVRGSGGRKELLLRKTFHLNQDSECKGWGT